MLSRIASVLLVLSLLAHDTCSATGQNRVFPLRADGTRLLDASGHDFVVFGDAAWTLLVALSEAEADEYLAARKSAGFNTVLVELIEPYYRGPANRNGDLPFQGAKPFSSPSPAYFQHARAIIELALKHEFLVLLTPAYVGYRCRPEGWCQAMLSTADPVLEQYGRYIATLLAPYPNIIWVHGGDVDAASYGAMPKVEAVYRGIDSVLPGKLHTAHCSRNLSAVDCYDRPWLNVNTTYSDCEQTLAMVVRDRLRVTDMPSIYIEGRYEEEKSTNYCVRSQLWWSRLGGSAGHVFGNRRIWRTEPDWRKALDTPGTRAMTVASRLQDRLDQSNQHLVPTLAPGELVVNTWTTALARLRESSYPMSLAWSAAVEREEQVAVAVSSATLVAYLPHLTSFRYTGVGRVACWMDPRSGRVVPLEQLGDNLQSPDGGDWLFVVERTTRDLCADSR